MLPGGSPKICMTQDKFPGLDMDYCIQILRSTSGRQVRIQMIYCKHYSVRHVNGLQPCHAIHLSSSLAAAASVDTGGVP